MIGSENSPISGHRVWPRTLGAVVLALALTACGGESLEAQVAAAVAEGDFTKVVGLWEPLAAKDGHAGSQFRMDVLYRTGNSVPKDNIIAYAWLRLAAARDVAPAVSHLSEVGDELDAGFLV
jgi:hypothetical protein